MDGAATHDRAMVDIRITAAIGVATGQAGKPRFYLLSVLKARSKSGVTGTSKPFESTYAEPLSAHRPSGTAGCVRIDRFGIGGEDGVPGLCAHVE